MVKLADLVHIANNAKTNAQKNAVGEEVKKLIRGRKACYPEKEFFTKVQTNPLIINKATTRLRAIGEGAHGTVFYGCIDDECKTQVAIKETTEETARMEFRIAEKLKGMGVPRMYHFKSCDRWDMLYFEYINGQSLQQWMKKDQKPEAYRSLISQLIRNLKRIHEKYPKFRHHDLHWNNILVLEGNKPIIIDFGLSTIEGIRNPNVTSGEYKNDGIYVGSHYMYDVHYILNIIYRYTKFTKVRGFIRDLFPEKYLGSTNSYIISGRLRPGLKHNDLPTYDQILNHPFLQSKKRGSILKRVIPKKKVMTPKPQPKVVAKPATGSAIRRAKAVLEKEAAKKKIPPKRPGIAKRDPSVMNQVRSIERNIATEKKVVTPKPKLRVFINKNGDLKIEKKKCRLYKKENLVKMFKLDPKLTKEQMCKFIKNM
jgi:predicted Ser/Thr protein kinase